MSGPEDFADIVQNDPNPANIELTIQHEALTESQKLEKSYTVASSMSEKISDGGDKQSQVNPSHQQVLPQSNIKLPG